MSEVAAFSINYSHFLAPDGQVITTLPAFAEKRAELVALYRAMVLTRTFDSKAIALQRTGRLGTYASSLGQEAVAVGIGAAMRTEDLLLPSFREQGAQIWRGVTLKELLLYWGGDERGNDFEGPREDFPCCVPVGTQAPHAVGVAMAFKLRSEARVAVCVFGDGATSKGDVYEAMNLAGVWQLPVIFVVNNNSWAISLPRSRQTSAETLAQKAIAAGFGGLQVDGNDVIAVRHAVEEALSRARSGEGPTLIEALTYRLGDHTTVDDASRYRDDAEVSRHWKDEPISRLRRYLGNQGYWDKAAEEALIEDSNAQVENATNAYLATSPQNPDNMFDYLYEELPHDLEEQRAALRRQARPEEEDGDG